MRKLILGGSFNPIHHGHLVCSRAVAEAMGFDRVILMPTAKAPHKPDSASMAAGGQRVAMLRASVAKDALFEVDELELGRTGPSYTIDTVNELTRREHGPIHWLIGADMLMYLPKWHRVDELMKKVEFVVMARPDCPIEWEKLPREFGHLRNNVVAAPLISISATEIRARVKLGLSIRYMTPDAVCEYIEREGLYR